MASLLWMWCWLQGSNFQSWTRMTWTVLVWSVCIVTVELVMRVQTSVPVWKKYVVLLCRSPNRYLYSADWFSQCAILYIKKKKKRHKYIYNSEFSGRVSLIIWSRVGLEKCLLMLRIFLYQRRGMKYLLILFEFLIVYVGGYPGVFLKSCSLSSSGDRTWILVARDRCWFLCFPCSASVLLHCSPSWMLRQASLEGSGSSGWFT